MLNYVKTLCEIIFFKRLKALINLAQWQRLGLKQILSKQHPERVDYLHLQCVYNLSVSHISQGVAIGLE